MARKEIQVVCKSVFKNGSGILKSEYTKKWIDMINRLEKRKQPKTRNV